MVFACFTPKPANTAPHAPQPKFTEAHEPRMVENTLAKEEPVEAAEQPAAPAQHTRASSKGAKSFVKRLGDSADKRCARCLPLVQGACTGCSWRRQPRSRVCAYHSLPVPCAGKIWPAC